MIRYAITIEGRPQAKERPRINRKTGVAFTPQKTKDYEAKIAKEAVKHIHEPLSGNDLTFIVRVYFRTKIHGDVDNYVKIAQDALNGIAYKDDKQIKHIEGHLFYCDTDAEMRMEIEIIDEEA